MRVTNCNFAPASKNPGRAGHILQLDHAWGCATGNAVRPELMTVKERPDEIAEILAIGLMQFVAEEGTRDAFRHLGVGDGKGPSYLSDPEKDLRRGLRAHARALGDAFHRSE